MGLHEKSSSEAWRRGGVNGQEERGKETRGRDVVARSKGLVKPPGEFYSSEERASPRRACVAVKPGSR